jgi:hypothetical protein
VTKKPEPTFLELPPAAVGACQPPPVRDDAAAVAADLERRVLVVASDVWVDMTHGPPTHLSVRSFHPLL